VPRGSHALALLRPLRGRLIEPGAVITARGPDVLAAAKAQPAGRDGALVHHWPAGEKGDHASGAATPRKASQGRSGRNCHEGVLGNEHRLRACAQRGVEGRGQPQPAGVYREEARQLEAAEGSAVELDGLRVDGLMTVGRLVTDPEGARSTFVALRGLAERLRARDARLGPELSMGMTDDFEVAVEEGATIVRVGRALFGERR